MNQLQVLLATNDRAHTRTFHRCAEQSDQIKVTLNHSSTPQDTFDALSSERYDCVFLGRLFSEDQAQRDFVKRLRQSTQTVPVILLTLSPEPDWAKELDDLLAVSILPTEQLTAPLLEMSLRHAMSERQLLEEREETNQKCNELQEQLQCAQKMEAVARLAGGIAHDFSNTLQAVIGFSDIVLQDDALPNRLADSVSEIKNAAEHSVDMTRHLLAFARKQTVYPEVVDLNDLFVNMRTMLRSLIGEDINLAWKPGTDLWNVHIDPGQVNQILTNLAVNSRDAIDGVGSITITTSNARFDAPFDTTTGQCPPGDYVCLSVSDTGEGMDSSTLNKVFDPFFTTKKPGEGTGLGLSTVYGIVKQNSGHINIKSKPGEGTTFDIYYPRYISDEEIAEDNSSTQQTKGGDETILLVEDETSILALEESRLKQLGYNVLSAPGCMKALTIARESIQEVDLLVTDVIMPEMNGSELSRKLRESRPDLKCLFMSGYPDNVLSPHGVLEEDTPFLQKPFTHDELAAKVREVLKS